MTLSDTRRGDTKPMNNSFRRNSLTAGAQKTAREAPLPFLSRVDLDGAPVVKHSATPFLAGSAKRTESSFIVEQTSLVTLPNTPLASPTNYEVRRSLPMKSCVFCQRSRYGVKGAPPARRTSWVYREKGWFMWYRVCWYHMSVGMKDVVKEMYSR